MGQTTSTAAASGLAYWKAQFAAADGRITDAMMAEMTERPGFVAASYAQLNGSLELNVSNPFSSRLATDLTRMMLAFILPGRTK